MTFWDNLRDTGDSPRLTREALEQAAEQIRKIGYHTGPLFFRPPNEPGVSTKSVMINEEMCECGDLPAEDCMCDEFDQEGNYIGEEDGEG